MFVYQASTIEDRGGPESGPIIQENWYDARGRSAKDATKRLQKRMKEDGWRTSAIREYVFSEADKLTGEPLNEFLSHESQRNDYWRAMEERRA